MTKIKRRGLVVFLDCIKRRKNGLSDDGGVHTEKKKCYNYDDVYGIPKIS